MGDHPRSLRELWRVAGYTPFVCRRQGRDYGFLGLGPHGKFVGWVLGREATAEFEPDIKEWWWKYRIASDG